MPYRKNPPSVPVELDLSEDELFLLLAAAERLGVPLDTFFRRCTGALYETHRPLPTSALPCPALVQAIA